MKTPFIPTAMRCTQEQFEAIKPKLVERGCEIIAAYGFSDHSPYLEAWIYQNEKHITITATSKNGVEHGSNIYEEWNEEIFLRNLGGEDVEVGETPIIGIGNKVDTQKNEIENLQKENTALKSTNIGLQAIVDTQKLTIDNCFKSIELKDIVIKRLQSRIAELTIPVEHSPETTQRPSLLQRLINRFI